MPHWYPRNEAADKADKHALDLLITEMAILREDYKLHVKNCIDREWQRKCDDVMSAQKIS